MGRRPLPIPMYAPFSHFRTFEERTRPMEKARDRKTNSEGRSNLIEMHLFDENAMEEKALCRNDVSVHDLITVQGHLERRRHELSLSTVCNACKGPAVEFARMRSAELADRGKTDEAEAYRRLAVTLSRETDPGLSGDRTG